MNGASEYRGDNTDVVKGDETGLVQDDETVMALGEEIGSVPILPLYSITKGHPWHLPQPLEYGSTPFPRTPQGHP